MMEVVEFFRGHPFLLGLAVGFIAVLFVWVRGLLRCRSLNREMARLKESLYTKMQIDAKGYMTRESELEQLKKENENLRITVKSLQNKPGRAEIRQLHVYDKAIHSMLARAPGFAPTWEMVLKEAEEEIARTDTGIAAFMRKVFVPRKQIPAGEDEQKLIDYGDEKNE
ncbi:MAG: hypothetical protein ACOX3E_08075 [Desulfomonilia bacterium]|jgi:cell division protein FtsB|nr:LapA family protein [Deltaproteobacteria bacterium]HPX19630.1 LapA family protein [Deltaproteobacteria bacterium]